MSESAAILALRRQLFDTVALTIPQRREMFKLVRILVAALMVLVTDKVMFCATAPPVSPEMTEWVGAHRALLCSMNTSADGGTLRPLGDAQMRPLLAQGWLLAEKWAGAWLDLHPNEYYLRNGQPYFTHARLE